jgi:glyoxylase-like metal-dependent hydrolase (beta-lactamase superfamily II)
MVTDRAFFHRWGFGFEVEPIAPGFLIEEPGRVELGGISFRILEVPGHCPGSLCFYLPEHGILFGGDVLFRGGTGRWDLPGGDKDLLFAGIRSKILPLPAETRVLPGHGPATSVGAEMRSNPWLQF